ncbi:MAG: hypothetical protein Q8O13_07860 [Candidatus Omnitrophota bacterium]|nr:hypothetical protein [Candidatus Omnitrophota bacterium]
MTSKEIKIKQEDKSASIDYLNKAKDNYRQMLLALENGNFNATATLAIQCAISSADCLCVFEKGIRSISRDHFDACDIIDSITIPEAKVKAKTLRKIIAKKNMVQYERRNIFHSEAEELVKLTDRFYHWVKSIVS